MSGNVFDLSRPGVAIPDPIAVDTNMVIAYVQYSFPEEDSRQVDRANGFFGRLNADDQTCVLTPTVYSEVLHIYIKKNFQRKVRGNRSALSAQYGTPIDTWIDLLKADPSLLRLLEPNLTDLRKALMANNMVVVGPEDLDFFSFPLSRPYGDGLIDRIVRYGMDTSDVVITMEASSLGLDAIVSLDRDMRRAQADFDVYTWL